MKTSLKKYSLGNFGKNNVSKAIPLAVAISSLSAWSYGQGMVLEEIVVTAQKRQESLQDVPVSVSALAASELEGFKLRDAGDIANQVPNLQQTSPGGDGFPIFSLRGVSMSDFSYNQSSPVASYVDEVYKGNPAIQGVQLFDIERVEVLRGPQGTLYGKNSTGGAINFITRTPSYETGGYLSVGAGNFNRREIRGAFEAPLIDDKLAVRVAGTWLEQDGWYENVNPGVDDAGAIDEYGIRAVVLWEPTDTLEIFLRVSTGKQEAVNYGVQPFNITSAGVGGGLYDLYSSFGATTASDSHREGLDRFELDSDQDEKRRIENDAVSLTINWELNGSYTLTSITSWDDGEIFSPEDTDGTYNQVLKAETLGEAEQVSQDLRITSDLDGPFNFIAGAYYAKEEVYNQTTIGYYTDLDLNADGSVDANDCLDVLTVYSTGSAATAAGQGVENALNISGASLADFAPAGCRTENDFDQERISYAIYTDASYAFDEAWTLRLGLRYTEDTTELSNYSARYLASDYTPMANTIPGDPGDPYATLSDRRIKDTEVTGKVGVDYTFDSGNMIYASFSHGYRNGGFNAQAYNSISELTSVEPETLDSLEIGFKSTLLEGAMELNGAVFHYAYENQQFLNLDPNTLAQTLVNIDESEINGLELEMRYRPFETLTLRSGLGWLDTEVKEGTLRGEDLSGNELLLAPKLNFNLAADWDFLLTSMGTFILRLESSWIDDHYFEIFNVDRMKQKGYWLHNARLQFESADESWSAGAWIRNLEGKNYRTVAYDFQDAFGYDYSQVGTPRMFGMDVSYHF
jgi:iron complex outermembrane receptor protein